MKRAIAALLALPLLLVAGARTPSAGAQTAPPAPAVESDILRLVSQTPVVEPDGDYVVRLRVTGTPAGSKVQVRVHDRVPTRSDFRATLANKVTRRVLGTFQFAAEPDASGVVVVTVPTRDQQNAAPNDPQHVRLGEGVFPVTIDLLSASGATLDSIVTYLIRMPVSREFGPFGVAVVVPVRGPLALRADGSTALDEASARAALSTASVLESHASIPLTVVGSPETIDALDASTKDELRAASTGRQWPLAPYVALRVSDWIAAGLRDDLDREFALGSKSLSSSIATPDETTYVADDRLTADGARFLAGRGVRALVVPEGALSPIDERLFNRTLTQPFDLKDVNGVRAVAIDPGLRAHAGATGDPVLDASQLLADLAVLYFDDPPDARAAVVALDPNRAVDPQFLDALLTGLDPTVNRILQPMSLSTLFTTVPPAGSRGETNGRGTPLTRALVPPASTDLAGFGTSLHAVDSDIASYREMVTADNPRPDELERRALVAGADGLSSGDRAAYLDGARNGVRAESAKIQPPGRQTINFTARDGVVSLTLHNTTGYPVKVRVQLEGQKLEFPGHEDGFVDVTLTEETTRLPLNVHTRASGDSPLDVTVTAPDGRIVIGHTRITIRSTAFSGVGVVLSIGALLFLAVWWLRHAIATRRDRRRRLKHLSTATRSPHP